MTDQDTCRIVRGNGSYRGTPGPRLFAGISAGERRSARHLHASAENASRSAGQGAPARGS